MAHRLSRRLSDVRKAGVVPYLRPDGKSQVSVEYRDGKPARVDTVLISAQHREEVDVETLLRPDVEAEVIDPVLREFPDLEAEGVRVLVNPTGRFEIGGPKADTGLTGRKIIVDTYGGMAPHGGGAFSARTPRRSTARPPTWPGTWPRTSWLRPGGQVPAPGRVRDRDRAPGVDDARYVRDRAGRRHETHPGDLGRLRLPARRDHPGSGPAPADLRGDGGLRTLRRKEFPWEVTDRVDELRSAVGA